MNIKKCIECDFDFPVILENQTICLNCKFSFISDEPKTDTNVIKCEKCRKDYIMNKNETLCILCKINQGLEEKPENGLMIINFRPESNLTNWYDFCTMDDY